MSQQNTAEMMCADALLPNTYTYQLWNAQQSGWPAAQLAPTLPGFEEHERQLYGMQAWPSATSSAGTIGPQEPADNCNDEAGPACDAAQFGYYGPQEEHLPDSVADSSLYHNASRQLLFAPDHQANAYNQDTLHQQDRAYLYQLYQANGMATGWPAEQADEALLLSGGRLSAKQQLFANAMDQENIDPASLYCHQQTGQQQQGQQQQQQQQRKLVESVKHCYGSDAEVPPVFKPPENNCQRGYVCASQDVEPMMGKVPNKQPAANNGRAPGHVLGSALGQSQPEVPESGITAVQHQGTQHRQHGDVQQHSGLTPAHTSCIALESHSLSSEPESNGQASATLRFAETLLQVLSVPLCMLCPPKPQGELQKAMLFLTVCRWMLTTLGKHQALNC